MADDSKKKVLVVEDSKEMRLVEKKILEKVGYDVVGLSDAANIINIIKRENPNVIIMDIRLPCKKRGIGAARLIRDTEETKHIPIIFVTAYVGGDQTSEIKNIPNCVYITKPFEVELLLEYIKKSVETK